MEVKGSELTINEFIQELQRKANEAEDSHGEESQRLSSMSSRSGDHLDDTGQQTLRGRRKTGRGKGRQIECYKTDLNHTVNTDELLNICRNRFEESKNYDSPPKYLNESVEESSFKCNKNMDDILKN